MSQGKTQSEQPQKFDFKAAAKDTAAERHKRQPSKGGRVQALNRLHSLLADHSQLYETGDLKDQRDAVAASLLAVKDYLIAQGFAQATLAPLMRPVSSLVERENNSLDLMFTERARGGRPKATMADHERTGILAALAEAWLRLHPDDPRTQAQKLEEAARQMRGRWFGKVTRAQLKTARDLVLQEGKNHLAVKHAGLVYSWFVKAAEMFGPRIAFDVMIHFFNENKMSFGGGEGGILKTLPVSPSEAE